MPTKIMEWPRELAPVLAVLAPADIEGVYRGELDLDPKLIFALNEFEAHARHRQVRFSIPGSDTALLGEMNTLIGLGPPREAGSGRSAHVRISFHGVKPAGPR